MLLWSQGGYFTFLLYLPRFQHNTGLLFFVCECFWRFFTLQFARSNQPATAAASAPAAPVASPAAPGPAVKKEYNEARLQVGVFWTAGGAVVVVVVWGCGWGVDRREDVFWCVCAYCLSLSLFFLIPPYQSEVVCRWSILKLGLPISSFVCIAIILFCLRDVFWITAPLALIFGIKL